MSASSHTNGNPSAANLHLILEEALKKYERLTGQDLTTHPLAAKLDNWDSAESVLKVFLEQARVFNEFHKDHRRLIEWLTPTVQTLITASAILGEALSPFPPAKGVFVGISVLLAAAAGVITNYDILARLFERIQFFLQRLNIYAGIRLTSALAELLGSIMAEIILILAIATKEMTRRLIKKYLKRLAGKTEIDDALQKLDSLTQAEAGIVAARGLALVDGLDSKMDLLQKQAKTVAQNQSREILRNWIAAPDIHDTAQYSLFHGTGTWFIHGETCKGWKTTGSLLWIRGIPGSGKSVLCSAIIEDIKRTRELVAYFDFDSKDPARRHVRGLLSSILAQLCNNSNVCWDLLSQLYAEHNDGSGASEDELAGCLKRTLKRLGQTKVYLVVDALDECPNTIGTPSPREIVLDLLEDLANSPYSNLHICVTSSLEQDIRNVLESLTSPPFTVSLHEESAHRKDIIRYVNSFVNSDREMRDWTAENKDLVIKSLLRRAGGMFGWAACMLDTLRRHDPEDLSRVLEELPPALDETYARALEKIPGEKQELAHYLFQCLVASVRPPRVEEVVEILAVLPRRAAAVKPKKDRWRKDSGDPAFSACSCLVTIVKDRDDEIVRFSHPSVKQFLTSTRLADMKGRNLSYYHVPLEPAHATVARACLTALLQLNDKLDDPRVGGPPLALYAVEHWVTHAKFGDVATQPLIQSDMEGLFDANKPHFRAWIRLHDMDSDQEGRQTTGSVTERPWQPTVTPLYYAVLCGLPSLVNTLISKRLQDVNERGGYHRTPLHAALQKEDLVIAELLLENRATVDARDKFKWRPLEKVLDDQHIESLRLLLKYKASANALDQYHWTPLRKASASGQLEVVRLLLQNGAQVNTPDALGWTPLHLASIKGHDKVAQLLLESAANVNALTMGGFTPLYVASSSVHVDVVKVLLRFGADVRLRGIGNQSPLRVALSQFTERHFKVAQLLSGNFEGW